MPAASQQHKMKAAIIILCFFCIFASFSCASTQHLKLNNVLFIAVDDLRPQLGAYGQSFMKTPNIDKLAAKSIVFDRAYCQIALCSPSRASMLTGRRPDSNHVWEISNDEYWRNVNNATTIPQYFKENGYVTIGMGKVFHPGIPSGNDDVAYSWSPEGLPYYHSILQQTYGPAHFHNASWESLQVPDDHLPDGDIANRAQYIIEQLKHNMTTHGNNRPFFLAVGFHKPHLPFIAPTEYFDLYPSINDTDLPKNPNPSKSMPPIAWSTLQELYPFNDIKSIITNQTQCNDNEHFAMHSKNCRIPDYKARELRRAYYAAVSYTDTQIGKVIGALEKNGLINDTVIVLLGDHGWQLGEHNEWSKHTNFENAVRVPLLISVPSQTDKGMHTKALVELVDVFPSIAELAGLPVPSVCPATVTGTGSTSLLTCVEGTSVAPLIHDPNRSWKRVVYSQYPRPYSGIRSISGRPKFDNEHGENVMGYTIRTDTYRFTEWYKFNRSNATPHWDDIWGTELYDHSVLQDPVNFSDENENIAADEGNVVQEMRKMLQDGWRSYIPKL